MKAGTFASPARLLPQAPDITSMTKEMFWKEREGELKRLSINFSFAVWEKSSKWAAWIEAATLALQRVGPISTNRLLVAVNIAQRDQNRWARLPVEQRWLFTPSSDPGSSEGCIVSFALRDLLLKALPRTVSSELILGGQVGLSQVLFRALRSLAALTDSERERLLRAVMDPQEGVANPIEAIKGFELWRFEMRRLIDLGLAEPEPLIQKKAVFKLLSAVNLSAMARRRLEDRYLALRLDDVSTSCAALLDYTWHWVGAIRDESLRRDENHGKALPAPVKTPAPCKPKAPPAPPKAPPPPKSAPTTTPPKAPPAKSTPKQAPAVDEKMLARALASAFKSAGVPAVPIAKAKSESKGRDSRRDAKDKPTNICFDMAYNGSCTRQNCRFSHAENDLKSQRAKQPVRPVSRVNSPTTSPRGVKA